MKNAIPNSIYGPVRSWRLGVSLGVDLLCIDSICSFECVYCQLGKINQVTTRRAVFVPTEKVLRDLENSVWRTVDVITFSGSGEPTLAENLGEAIRKIGEFTGKPTVVLTNSTLLDSEQVRAEISGADQIFCKLDAWSDEILRRIDRPAHGVSLKSIISGIGSLRREYEGFLAIQTMIVRRPKTFEIKRFADILRSINPAEVQLNLPMRPVPPEYFPETRGNEVEFADGFRQLRTISAEDLEDIRQRLAGLTGLPIITRQVRTLEKAL